MSSQRRQTSDDIATTAADNDYVAYRMEARSNNYTGNSRCFASDYFVELAQLCETSLCEVVVDITVPYELYTNFTIGQKFRWRGGLVVGRRTCDLVVAGSRPGRDAAA